MAIADNSLIEIAFNMRYLGQTCMNVWQYQIIELPAGVTLVQILEAYWDHVKATYRATIVGSLGDTFVSLIGRELNVPSGDIAEYPIDAAERPGTRPNLATGDFLPPFNAAAVRLTVSTRVTRPGQKRFVGLGEIDSSSGVLLSSFSSLVNALMVVMTDEMTLGAPAALTGLLPVVTRQDALGVVTAHQPVTGFVINPNVSSQVSRKVGRGV